MSDFDIINDNYTKTHLTFESGDRPITEYNLVLLCALG